MLKASDDYINQITDLVQAIEASLKIIRNRPKQKSPFHWLRFFCSCQSAKENQALLEPPIYKFFLRDISKLLHNHLLLAAKNLQQIAECSYKKPVADSIAAVEKRTYLMIRLMVVEIPKKFTQLRPLLNDDIPLKKSDQSHLLQVKDQLYTIWKLLLSLPFIPKNQTCDVLVMQGYRFYSGALANANQSSAPKNP